MVNVEFIFIKTDTYSSPHQVALALSCLPLLDAGGFVATVAALITVNVESQKTPSLCSFVIVGFGPIDKDGIIHFVATPQLSHVLGGCSVTGLELDSVLQSHPLGARGWEILSLQIPPAGSKSAGQGKRSKQHRLHHGSAKKENDGRGLDFIDVAKFFRDCRFVTIR